jgi:mono/diheme cytochrome c family protein
MPTWNGQISNADIAAVASYVRSAWGNKAAPVTEQQVTATGTAVMTAVGSSIYAKRCVTCHAANGHGGGPFPALAGNADVNLADPMKMLATIVHGKNVMPSWKGQLSPGEIAAVATYVRGAWGNHGGPVSEAAVTSIK